MTHQTFELSRLPAVILTSKATEKRLPGCIAQLRSHGHQRILIIHGQTTRPYWKALNQSWREALRNTPPYLVVEDDCRPHPLYYRPLIRVPIDADAIQMGSSAATIETPQPPGWQTAPSHARWPALRFRRVNRDIVQIRNMLFTHALLIVTQKGAEAFRKDLLQSQPPDVSNIVTQGRTVQYAPIRTYYFQDDPTHREITYAGVSTLFRQP